MVVLPQSAIKKDSAKDYLLSLIKDNDFKEVRAQIILSLKDYVDKDVYYKVIESFDNAEKDGEKYRVDAEDMFKVIVKDNKYEFYKLFDGGA